MMTTVTLTICDVCVVAGEERFATKHTIVIDGRRYQLDLCDEHDGAILAPLVEAITGAGRHVRGGKVTRLVRPSTKTSPLQIKCTEPGCDRTFDTEERRNRHIGQGHKRKATVVAFSA